MNKDKKMILGYITGGLLVIVLMPSIIYIITSLLDKVYRLEKASKNKGIILTDHDYRNVFDIANRYCLIFDGGIKLIKDKFELVKWGYVSESKI